VASQLVDGVIVTRTVPVDPLGIAVPDDGLKAAAALPDWLTMNTSPPTLIEPARNCIVVFCVKENETFIVVPVMLAELIVSHAGSKLVAVHGPETLVAVRIPALAPRSTAKARRLSLREHGGKSCNWNECGPVCPPTACIVYVPLAGSV
jgi:hypothetical protein